MRCQILTIFLSLCGIAGGVEPSVVRSREKAGDYAAALELCMNTPDETFSAYFIGDYLFHGRKGIVQNQISGRKSYLKAIPGLTALAKEGMPMHNIILGVAVSMEKTIIFRLENGISKPLTMEIRTQ